MTDAPAKTNPWQLLGLIGDSDLPPPARHLLCMAVKYLDAQSLRMYPSLERLALDTGYTTRSVRRIVSNTLIPRGVLVPDGPRRGGRNLATGMGLTTTYRLDLDALARCQRPPETPDTGSGHDPAYPDTGDTVPGHSRPPTRTLATESPDTGSAKPPSELPENTPPTPTAPSGGAGGGGGAFSSDEEENRKLLAGVVGSADKLDRIARRFDRFLVAAMVRYAQANGLGGGWLAKTLLDGSPPSEVLAAAERARAGQEEEAARLAAARARLAAVPPERLAAAAARAGVAPEDTSAPALDALADALDAMAREDADAAERQRLADLWGALTDEERETLRCRFQFHFNREVLDYAAKSPRKREEVLAEIDSIRQPTQKHGGAP